MTTIDQPFRPENISKIKILDIATANQIAAGEVVERPASLVKELVENAIDAGADKIEVKIKQAGLQSIQVTDNGSGMCPEDMRKSIQPHATSKLRRIEDLQVLGTLGFRGEALAAIASVSKLDIVSKQPGDICGYRFSSVAGKGTIPEEIGAPDGTKVLVEELFFNTPARKKFLKSNSYEVGQISDYLNRLALSRPHIAFTLQSEGKTLLKTTGSGSLEQVFLSVYGKEAAERMVRVEFLQNMIINGLISLPDNNRPNRQHYNFFINNRWVRSKELSQYVDEAYRTLIPQGRYPVVALFLQMAPSMLDVNVHPAKLEIKLKEPEQIKNSLISAISIALNKKELFSPRFGSNGKSELFRMEEKQVKTGFSPSQQFILKEAETIKKDESGSIPPVQDRQPSLNFLSHA